MVAKALSVALLAGAASATCPLSIEITNSENHVVNVAVTNTGSEAVSVFKGNTVFSDHATQDLLVTDAEGKALPFEGIYVNYKRTGLDANLFQKIAAGETVTVPVNAAKSYKLDGVAEAKVTAIQGFRYAVGDSIPSSFKDLASCADVTSGEVEVTPDQTTAAADHVSRKRDETFNSRIQKRAITYSSCSTSQTSALKTSVSDAISMANAAYTAAGNSADYFTTWFKSTSVISKVQTIYKDVAGVQTTSPKISCSDIYSDCTDGSALLYTVPSDNVIVPCPNNGFWDFPELASKCSGDDYDRAGSILHEMTHLYGTNDYAYGPSAAQALSATRAAANADTYEMYGESVRLGGCTTG
ncbi:deuterolysin metalloprotease [Colletotrichum orchidophilum]|uniref:deuterolysin n=1 Tax=Colletotrichum orchidophilum TaxID=1209926 RepID=A0A1G4BRV4_9PEZI|nr:deuterolysin metalloprotease [Colletotrichum orchidophilum]OHF04141.1 deuterolysin metalloprotease [Colletotrichum orchidophilum]